MKTEELRAQLQELRFTELPDHGIHGACKEFTITYTYHDLVEIRFRAFPIRITCLIGDLTLYVNKQLDGRLFVELLVMNKTVHMEYFQYVQKE